MSCEVVCCARCFVFHPLCLLLCPLTAPRSAQCHTLRTWCVSRCATITASRAQQPRLTRELVPGPRSWSTSAKQRATLAAVAVALAEACGAGVGTRGGARAGQCAAGRAAPRLMLPFSSWSSCSEVLVAREERGRGRTDTSRCNGVHYADYISHLCHRHSGYGASGNSLLAPRMALRLNDCVCDGVDRHCCFIIPNDICDVLYSVWPV